MLRMTLLFVATVLFMFLFPFIWLLFGAKSRDKVLDFLRKQADVARYNLKRKAEKLSEDLSSMQQEADKISKDLDEL